MFYRLQAELQTAARLDVSWLNVGPGTYLDSREFELRLQKIQVVPDWPHCNVFRAPEQDEDRHGSDAKFPAGKENEWIPDVWAQGELAIVSETVRRVIEESDDFGHQFWPMSFLDHKGNVVNDKPYFFLNVRRILNVKNLGFPMQAVDFSPLSWEEEFLPTIQNTPALRNLVETLPLWRHSPGRPIIYLNQAMVDRLRAANVTGMDEVVNEYDVDEECLAHV